jgi:dephospho-CoA kinase
MSKAMKLRTSPGTLVTRFIVSACTIYKRFELYVASLLDADLIDRKVVIGVAGMPGAGKSVVARVAKKTGGSVVVMGDEVRRETRRRGLELTPPNVGKVMLQMRREGGPEAVARRCLPAINKAKSRLVVVDGIRSIHEARHFRETLPNFKLLALHSSPKTRFKRLFKRKRSDDPANWSTFTERDQRELHVGIGQAIATADVMIVNEGRKREFEEAILKVLQEVTRSERAHGAS